MTNLDKNWSIAGTHDCVKYRLYMTLIHYGFPQKNQLSFQELPDYDISILKDKFLTIFADFYPVEMPRKKRTNLHSFTRASNQNKKKLKIL